MKGLGQIGGKRGGQARPVLRMNYFFLFPLFVHNFSLYYFLFRGPGIEEKGRPHFDGRGPHGLRRIVGRDRILDIHVKTHRCRFGAAVVAPRAACNGINITDYKQTKTKDKRPNRRDLDGPQAKKEGENDQARDPPTFPDPFRDFSCPSFPCKIQNSFSVPPVVSHWLG